MPTSGELTVVNGPLCGAGREESVLQGSAVAADRAFPIAEPGTGSAAGFLRTNALPMIVNWAATPIGARIVTTAGWPAWTIQIVVVGSAPRLSSSRLASSRGARGAPQMISFPP